MRIFRLLLIILTAFILNGCNWSNFPLLYKPDIQQGNILPSDQIAALKIGMDRDEVNYLLGTPVLVNIIDTQTTQYVYTFKTKKSPLKKTQLLLTFRQDRLTKIDNN